MKTRTVIEEITHDDLVNLLSTATFGNEWLDMQFDRSKVEREDGDCYEDIAAKILLAGGTIEMIDNYAEDSDDVYSNTGYWETDAAIYPITLEDIKRGLANAADMNINNDVGEKKYALRAYYNFAEDDEDLDFCYADALMQVIMFNEIIYG